VSFPLEIPEKANNEGIENALQQIDKYKEHLKYNNVS